MAVCFWSGVAYAKTIILTYNSGTGFFVSGDGYVLTNNHVVQNCREITVNGAVALSDAAVVARDASYDLALLKTSISSADIGRLSSQKQPLNEGDPVIIVGYPGQSWKTGRSVTSQARILNLRGPYGDERWMEFSDVLEQGNSGGPLLDASGNVVGVVAAKARSFVYNKAEQRAENIRHFDLAVSLPAIRSFLSANNIYYQEADSGLYLSTDRVTDKAQHFVVNVRCRYNK